MIVFDDLVDLLYTKSSDQKTASLNASEGGDAMRQKARKTCSKAGFTRREQREKNKTELKAVSHQFGN